MANVHETAKTAIGCRLSAIEDSGTLDGQRSLRHSVVLAPGSSKIEPGITPAHPVTLPWHTFTAAADETSLSHRYGGIHFRPADLAGRQLGRHVAAEVWTKAQSYSDGTAGSKGLAVASAPMH
jgi:hypothetical protein